MKVTTGSKARKLKRTRGRAAAIEQSNKILESMAPDLASDSPKPDAGLSKSHCREIIDRIQQEVPMKYMASVRIHIRSRLQKISENVKGKVHLPDYEAFIRRDKSPMSGNALTQINHLGALIDQFNADIHNSLSPELKAKRRAQKKAKLAKIRAKNETRKKSARKSTRRTRFYRHVLGRIIFSAIVNGGLIYRKRVDELLPILINELRAYQDCAWVFFPADEGDATIMSEEDVASKMDSPGRRWFLDPITLALLVDFRSSPAFERIKDKDLQQPIAALNQYLSFLRRSCKRDPAYGRQPSWTTAPLIRAASARLSLYLPQVLMQHLKGSTYGPSMSERSWWRCKFGKVLPRQKAKEVEAELSIDLALEVEKTTHAYQGEKDRFFRVQEKLVDVLRACLGKDGRRSVPAENHVAVKNLLRALEEHGELMAPLVHGYFNWIVFKLTRPSRAKGGIITVSASRYTCRLADKLVAFGAEIDFKTASATDWGEFYDDVLEAIDSNTERRHAVGNLRDFHSFLVMAYGVPDAMINGQEGSLPDSRITMVSLEDYDFLISSLNPGDRHSHLLTVIRLIIMLCYRAGLRPHETIDLEFRHVSGYSLQYPRKRISDVVLYLRATSKSELKTSSAVRQIPLNWVLLKHELGELYEYLDYRLATHKGGDVPSLLVFPSTAGENAKLSQRKIFSIIGELLRQVTQDHNVVSYTLRHSFLSNLFLRTIHPRLDKTAPLHRNEALPREAIYTLSTIAGHLDPTVSLSNYIHTMDYAAFLYLGDALQSTENLELWAVLEKTKVDSLKKRRNRRAESAQIDRDDIDTQFPQWLDTYKRLIHKLGLQPPRFGRRQKPSIPEELLESNSLLDLNIDTLHALFMSFHRDHTEAARARLFGVPQNQVKGLLKWSQSLAGMKTSPQSGRATSRMLRSRKTGKKLPAVYRRAQAGSIAPSPPNNSRAEHEEAQRIFKLLVKRARSDKMDRERIRQEIIAPIHHVLSSFSRGDAAVRITSASQLRKTVQAIRSLRIPASRIQVEIIALPGERKVGAKSWQKELKKMAGSKKLRMHPRNISVSKRMKSHPKFGVVHLKVMELVKREIALLDDDKSENIGKRGGSGWRVGCFYGIAAISGYFWADA